MAVRLLWLSALLCGAGGLLPVRGAAGSSAAAPAVRSQEQQQRRAAGRTPLQHQQQPPIQGSPPRAAASGLTFAQLVKQEVEKVAPRGKKGSNNVGAHLAGTTAATALCEGAVLAKTPGVEGGQTQHEPTGEDPVELERA